MQRPGGPKLRDRTGECPGFRLPPPHTHTPRRKLRTASYLERGRCDQVKLLRCSRPDVRLGAQSTDGA